MTEIEKLLDDNNNEPIILYNEQGKPTKFDQIAVIPINGIIYAILSPITPIDGVGEDEGLVFRLDSGDDDEEVLTLISDDQTIDQVFEVYYKLLDEANGN